MKTLMMSVRNGRGELMYRLEQNEAELREQGVGFTSQHGQLAWTCTLIRGTTIVATCKRGVWDDAPAPTRRGTSNTNQRGNSEDRARRKLHLLTVYESDQGAGTARCYRCGTVLTADTVTVDRIIPGARGGKYVRSNIRPACAKCNSETGGAVRG